jgi:Membrane carboxypeptidase (penicillin-binding protein)
MLKTIRRLVILSFIFVLIISSYYLYQGYSLYRKVISNKDIVETINTIKSKDTFITIDEIPLIYHDAVISIEDPSFYSHDGINIFSITKAFFKNIQRMSYVEGGSTITQQIAKNVFFTQDKNLERKIAEVFMAYQLEKYYTKVELFEVYINICYFGDGYTGIFEASIGYFDKMPIELTDYEATLLAGVPNAPSVYALTNNLELAKQRQRIVIEKMIKYEFITENQGKYILFGF